MNQATPLTDEELRAGYDAMAADTEREAEALAWIELHLNDGLDDDDEWLPFVAEPQIS